jgi:hypothetical protein
MPPKAERFEIRMDPELVERIDRWRSRQPGVPTRAEAIRRLVESMLQIQLGEDREEKPARKPGSRVPRVGADVARKMIAAAGLTKPPEKSSQMAGKVIDRLSDDAAMDDERARRERRLIKGPTEFQELRGQRPKQK